jgi:hypothetical protein
MMFGCLLACSWPWPGSDAATAEAEGAAAKAAAADVLSALLAQPTHGPRVSLLLHKLLPPGLVATIAEGPPEAVMRALRQVRSQLDMRVIRGFCGILLHCRGVFWGGYCGWQGAACMFCATVLRQQVLLPLQCVRLQEV